MITAAMIRDLVIAIVLACIAAAAFNAATRRDLSQAGALFPDSDADDCRATPVLTNHCRAAFSFRVPR